MKIPLSIICVACMVLLSGCGIPKSSFTTSKAEVLKVYSTSDGGHNFVAYVVKRAGVEVIVSDPQGKSSYKVGDTIEYLDQKIKFDSGTGSLSFTLLD